VAAALPVGSFAIYRTGARPAIFDSGSLGFPDTTRACWRAYLSGPVRRDASFGGAERLRLCHITARDVPPEHRAKVYEAHGVRERVSVVEAEAADAGDVFAVNFYRHEGQRALSDAQIADFGDAGALLMALARKHVALAGAGTVHAPAAADAPSPALLSARLAAQCPRLTPQELAVCTRILQGLTLEGIAADMGLALPSVKTYRQRAFARMGIHFRSELFARVLDARAGVH
jgi:DNA-binding CsgD family transcriptional regulator